MKQIFLNTRPSEQIEPKYILPRVVLHLPINILLELKPGNCHHLEEQHLSCTLPNQFTLSSKSEWARASFFHLKH